MIMVYDLRARIDEIFEIEERDYKKADELEENGNIGERFGRYLKNLIHMRSCCDIAKLFAETLEKKAMSLKLWEASFSLDEINSICIEPFEEEGLFLIPHFSEYRGNLMIYAHDYYRETVDDCKKMLGEARAA